MPIYVYEPTVYSLDEDVHDCCFFECLQKIADKPFANCPTCGHSVHRAVTSFHVGSEVQNSNYQLAFHGKERDSPAKRAAKLAMRHVCATGCKH